MRCGDRILGKMVATLSVCLYHSLFNHAFLLEFNGVSLRESTAEEAAYELAKPMEKVTLFVQYDIERYRDIAEQPGDSFHVRAQFDKTSVDGHEQMELCFRRDDILHVDNTMFNGVPGECGFIELVGSLPHNFGLCDITS